MKYAGFALLALTGCAEYISWDLTPEEKPKPKLERPKQEPEKKEQEKEPEYKPPDFPYFDDKEEHRDLGPHLMKGPSTESIPQYRYYQYPGFWYGPYGVYPQVYPWWAGYYFQPAYHIHEHHDHATGTSTYEITPGPGFPYGWGATYEHHHH